MSRSSVKPINIFFRWLLEMVAIFFIVFFVLGVSYFLFVKTYENKIYPGVYIGNINLGGKTVNEALYLLNKKIDNINQKGIKFVYKDEETVLYPVVSSLEGDLAYPIINFDSYQTISNAFAYGRQGNVFTRISKQAKALSNHVSINLVFSLNSKEIKKILHNRFANLEESAQDAHLIFFQNKNQEIDFWIEKEKLGQAIDYDRAIKKLTFNLSYLDVQPIRLFAYSDYPKIYKKDCKKFDVIAEEIVNLAPFTLIVPSQIQTSSTTQTKWTIDKNTLASWLVLKLTNNDLDPVPYVGIDYQKVRNYLNQYVAPIINKQPINAKFKIKDGKVIEFQTSKDGQKLNIDATLAKLEFELIQGRNKEIEIAVSELKSNIQMQDVNNLGIREIIGTGQSNFSGSPKNRRHNILVGADKLNGVLIRPGEEFSLLAALGEINKEAGYLPELVIKDNRTVPEYGGGLCQIGTTIFRAALRSGLPITMRRNHSYRVSYYEPAGTDATIYDPWPDLRFINDTGHYILIQARIEGDDLYFDFWGTKDGRKVEISDPVIYNIVKPGPTKYIETLDLPPGEKKCTEHAHSGADAYFDYKVTYPDGTTKEKRFTSHYVPWREVCLIGVEKLSSETENKSNLEDNATSTLKNIE